MTVTVESMRNRFPEFKDEDLYPDDRIQLAIDDALIHFSFNGWPAAKKDLGHHYLAAHLLTLQTITEDTTGEGGGSDSIKPVSSEKVGDVSVSYAVSAVNPSDPETALTSTIYGQQFVQLRNLMGVGVMGVQC